MEPQGVLSLLMTVVALAVGTVAHVVAFDARGSATRWFGWSAFGAALFGFANFAIVASKTNPQIVFFAGLAYFGAGLYGFAALVFCSALGARPMTRFELGISSISIALGGVALLPGVAVGPAVLVRESWWGLVYRDAVPTAVANLAGAFAAGTMVLLLLRGVELVRRKRAGGRAIVFSGLACALATANDVAAFANLTRMPYLCDFAFLATMLITGATLARHGVTTAAALELAAARLKAAQAELVHKKQLAALGEMSAVIAHEVRSPVAVIFNVVALLRRDDALHKASTTSLIETLGEEAERLRRLVEELLDFVRPLPLQVGEHSVERLVRSAIAAACVPDANLVEFDAEPKLPPFVGDEQLLHQALVNLVRNAVAPPVTGNRVRVRCSSGADHLHIDVIDSGTGVLPEDRARLFTPFFTTRATGTGLGLAVVKKIAEAHGGAASFEPTPGGGATFRLALPRTAAP
ncbi:MAG: hypothetical protein EXR75_00755 [Myxococcales bacterium]|nr:hypothetical protein [Myxococcales bacterium]